MTAAPMELLIPLNASESEANPAAPTSADGSGFAELLDDQIVRDPDPSLESERSAADPLESGSGELSQAGVAGLIGGREHRTRDAESLWSLEGAGEDATLSSGGSREAARATAPDAATEGQIPVRLAAELGTGQIVQSTHAAHSNQTAQAAQLTQLAGPIGEEPGGRQPRPAADSGPASAPVEPAVSAAREIPDIARSVVGSVPPQPSQREVSSISDSRFGRSTSRDARDASVTPHASAQLEAAHADLPNSAERIASLDSARFGPTAPVNVGSEAPTGQSLFAQAGIAPVSTSEAAAPSATPTPAAAAAPVEDVPVRIEWLAQRGGGTARVQLDPPQLGRVELSVRLRGSDVEVVIVASEPLAQAAVHAQRAQLAENLAARDLRLTQFTLNDPGGEGADGSNTHDAESGPESNGQEQPLNRDRHDRGFAGAAPANADWLQNVTHWSPEPDGGSGPTSRIDLHI